jgi:hypothetical protein
MPPDRQLRIIAYFGTDPASVATNPPGPRIAFVQLERLPPAAGHAPVPTIIDHGLSGDSPAEWSLIGFHHAHHPPTIVLFLLAQRPLSPGSPPARSGLLVQRVVRRKVDLASSAAGDQRHGGAAQR